MYETFLRKQILDHSSNDKCYIKTVLGRLAAFVGVARCVLTHTPELYGALTVSHSLTKTGPQVTSQLCAAREGGMNISKEGRREDSKSCSMLRYKL